MKEEHKNNSEYGSNCENPLDVFEKLSPYFHALGDPVRQQIIVLLSECESLNVTQISDRIPMSRPTISHHLKILRQAGIVQVQKKGTEMYYRLEIKEVIELFKVFIHVVEKNCL